MANFDNIRELSFDKVCIGISKSTDFGCEGSKTFLYRGATLFFTNGLLYKIEAYKNSDAFRLLMEILVGRENAHLRSFNSVNQILREKGFVSDNSSLEPSGLLKVVDKAIRPSSLFGLSAMSIVKKQAKLCMSNYLRAEEGYATYKEELKKNMEGGMCILKFQHNECTGYDKIEKVRFCDTLKAITLLSNNEQKESLSEMGKYIVLLSLFNELGK